LNSIVSAGFVLAFGMMPAIALPSQVVAADAVSPVVLELFTSQGCSSCPPADSILDKFSEDSDVIPLSFHVDYWDYIGWKDTFASKVTTARQHAYARSMGQRHVYTPQVVVNGRHHVVGSDEGEIRRAVVSAKDKGVSLTSLDLRKDGDSLKLAVSGAGNGPSEAWLFGLDRQQEVTIRRGENSGRKLIYSNVVRDVHLLGRWSGGDRSFEIRPDRISASPRDGYVIIVQAENHGPVLAATRYWVKKPQ
jgi:hypothetical protein